MFKNFIKKYRTHKADKRWRHDFPEIEEGSLELMEPIVYSEDVPFPIKRECKRVDRDHYWLLLRKEIASFIEVGEKISLAEFAACCWRNKFDRNEIGYLKSMLEFLGLF